MKKETAITLTEISKYFFGTLTLFNYIFATTNRTSAILIPFILCIISIVINKTK